MRITPYVVIIALVGFTGCGLFGGGERATPPAQPVPSGDALGDRTAVGGLQPHEMWRLDDSQHGDHVDAFYAQGYHYCDAVMLAGLWELDTWDAKVKAGYLVRQQGTDAVGTAVESARSATRAGRIPGCGWDMLASFEDIVALSQLWGQDTSEVKARVERKAAWGQHALLAEEIALAQRSRDGHGVETEGEELDAAMAEERWLRAFFDSPKVDYCHARMLSAAWGGSVSEAKSTLGYKVAHQLWDSLAMAKEAARQHAQETPSARCSFVETSFTPADARKLASLWSISLAEAEAALASKYTYGLEDSVRAELRGG